MGKDILLISKCTTDTHIYHSGSLHKVARLDEEAWQEYKGRRLEGTPPSNVALNDPKNTRRIPNARTL